MFAEQKTVKCPFVGGATGEDRTRDLLITNEVLYH